MFHLQLCLLLFSTLLLPLSPGVSFLFLIMAAILLIFLLHRTLFPHRSVSFIYWNATFSVASFLTTLLEFYYMHTHAHVRISFLIYLFSKHVAKISLNLYLIFFSFSANKKHHEGRIFDSFVPCCISSSIQNKFQ